MDVWRLSVWAVWHLSSIQIDFSQVHRFLGFKALPKISVILKPARLCQKSMKLTFSRCKSRKAQTSMNL